MAQKIQINEKKQIGENEPCFIIAEAGQNHQGDIKIAKNLITAAKESGADCVKFQKSCLAEKFNAAALARPYNSPNSWGETYGEHKTFLEFSFEDYRELQQFAKEIGILFTASPMDIVSVDFLDSIDVPFFKIGSGDANNLPLLEHAAKKGRPMIVSTGMQNMSSVQEIYHTLKAHKVPFCLLHCVSAYPAKPDQINLRVLETYKREFPDVNIGYSGHELGTSISIAAVAMGVRILERHLTMDRTWKGSDHVCSLTPEEFQDLVMQIRTVESAMGCSQKRFQVSEQDCYKKLGKTLVAACTLSAGTIVQPSHIKIKVAEPKGLPASYYKDIIGKMLNENVREDESILLHHIC